MAIMDEKQRQQSRGKKNSTHWPNSICRVGAYDKNAYTYYPIVVIGAGESGIAIGCRLKQLLKFDQFRIFDSQAGIGGTWHINRYPGVACDVPAAFYSFSFAPNPRWSTFYPSGPEIVKYLTDVCSKFEITDKIQCNTKVDECKWLEDEGVWEVVLTHLAPGMGDMSKLDLDAKIHRDGPQSVYLSKEIIRAKVVVSCVGGLREPLQWPSNVPGIDGFEGKMFHTARWRHDVDVTDKNVVVIGTGCSAAQVVPQLIKEPYNAKSVTQLMRSPPWVAPRSIPPGGVEGYEKYSPVVFNRFPALQSLLRFFVFLGTENLYKIFRTTPGSQKRRKKMEKELLEYLYKTAPEKYHQMMTPNYTVACKRLVFDPRWLESLHSHKVELTSQPLTRINPNSVTLGAGSLYPVKGSNAELQEREVPADIIVLSNGFETTRYFHPLNVTGRDGKDLIDEMEARGGSQLYQGTAMDGFPNFLVIFGPNIATGHSSVILQTESQVTYALKFIKLILNGDIASFEVKKEAEESYTADIQSALKSTVWADGGCRSWYFNEKTGWNSTMYPYSQPYFLWRCTFPTWSDWNLAYTRTGVARYGIGRVLRVLGFLLLITGAYAMTTSGFNFAHFFSSLRSVVSRAQLAITTR